MEGRKPDAPEGDSPLESGWSEAPPPAKVTPKGSPARTLPLAASDALGVEGGGANPAEGDGTTERRDISAFVAAMEAKRAGGAVEVLPPAVVVGPAMAAAPAPPPPSSSPSSSSAADPVAEAIRAAPPAPVTQPIAPVLPAAPRDAGPPAAAPVVVMADPPAPCPTFTALFAGERGPRTAALLGVGALVGVLCSLAAGAALRPRARPALPPVPPERAAAVVSAIPSAGASRSVADRARGGDPAAMSELMGRDQAARSIAESVALFEGRDAAARARVDAVAARLRANPAALDAPELRRELWELLTDPRTATRALAVVAELPNSHGPDLLFRVWTTTAARTDATELAEMLLYSPAVRARASPELAIALDLRRTRDCEQLRALLAPATTTADARAMRPLAGLAATTGCGDRDREDCFACLRQDPKALDAALRAARSRPPPKFP